MNIDFNKPEVNYEKLRKEYIELLDISRQSKYLMLTSTLARIIEACTQNEYDTRKLAHDVFYAPNDDTKTASNDSEAQLNILLDRFLSEGSCSVHLYLPDAFDIFSPNYCIRVKCESSEPTLFARILLDLQKICPDFKVDPIKDNQIVTCSARMQNKGCKIFVQTVMHLINVLAE